MTICPVEQCTGCYACSNICPKNCIRLIADENGHVIPVIEEDICINCGLCKKVCPVNHPVKQTSPLKAYASWSLDEDDRKTSSSGAAASVFSKHVMHNGGIVYGASLLKDGDLYHERIEQKEDLYKLKGSKYVQSAISDAFQKVKTDLLAARAVLFIGTPCQVAGLKNYLEHDYNNLTTVDIICHGVPGMQLFRDHIISKTGSLNFDAVSFRENGLYQIKVIKDSEIKYSESLYRDVYYMGFMKGLFCRESCYSCTYATAERVADITIGDFWGLGKLTPFNHSLAGGVSLLLPITSKGLDLIDSCRGSLFLEEREIDEAVAGNAQLKHPSIKNKNTEKFNALYKKYGFEKAANDSLKKQKIKYRLLELLALLKGVKKRITR